MAKAYSEEGSWQHVPLHQEQPAMSDARRTRRRSPAARNVDRWAVALPSVVSATAEIPEPHSLTWALHTSLCGGCVSGLAYTGVDEQRRPTSALPAPTPRADLVRPGSSLGRPRVSRLTHIDVHLALAGLFLLQRGQRPAVERDDEGAVYVLNEAQSHRTYPPTLMSEVEVNVGGDHP